MAALPSGEIQSYRAERLSSEFCTLHGDLVFDRWMSRNLAEYSRLMDSTLCFDMSSKDGSPVR